MHAETDVTTSGAVLEAALQYAKEGMRVFPTYGIDETKPGGCACGKSSCSSPGKHPLTSNGHRDATTDPEVIQKWWDKWPEANVAVRPGPNQFVVDVDPRNGGNESLKKLEGEHGRFDTKRIRTGSGGLHLWFTTPTPVHGRNNVLPGIDIKTESGYVLMPPSQHVSGQYSLEDGAAVVKAPQSLIDLIGHAPERREIRLRPLSWHFAPGANKEERDRWTGSALDAIPNEGAFDDRGRWVGMAHALRASMPDDEAGAFDHFDRFSRRWKGGTYESDETRRVWDTLPGSTGTRGYPQILERAIENGYALPPDHPQRAENEFSADPDLAAVTQILEAPAQCGIVHALELVEQVRLDSHVTLIEATERALASCVDLAPAERAVVKGRLVKKLEGTLGRAQVQDLLRALEPSSEDTAFSRDVSGVPSLQRLRAEDMRLSDAYLVHKRIPAGGVGALISDYSLGKTLLTIDLGCSIAFGRRWLGCTTETAPVVYLVAEGNRAFADRIFGWLYAKGILPRDSSLSDLFKVLEGRVIISRYPPRFDDPDFELGLITTVQQSAASLVVIDTLGKTLGDEQAENDNDVANSVTGMLSRIAFKTGCTALVTHHTGYNKTRARGGSGWVQGLDFAYMIEGDSAGLDAGQPVRLVSRKMRDGPRPKEVQFCLRKLSGLSLTSDPDEESVDVESAIVEMVDSPVEAPKLSTDAIVFQYIEANPGCSAQSVRGGVEGANARKTSAVKDLLQRGAIEDQGASNRHRYNARPGWRINRLGQVEYPGDEFETSISHLEADLRAQDGES